MIGLGVPGPFQPILLTNNPGKLDLFQNSECRATVMFLLLAHAEGGQSRRSFKPLMTAHEIDSKGPRPEHPESKPKCPGSDDTFKGDPDQV
jgi:hypothetical protein